MRRIGKRIEGEEKERRVEERRGNERGVEAAERGGLPAAFEEVALGAEGEGAAVDGGYAVAEDAFAVFLGGIAGVVVPAVVGIEAVLVFHVVVAVGFG